MKKRAWLATTIAALSLVLPVTAGTAPAQATQSSQSARSSTAHSVSIDTLPVGARARIDYLTGRLLHTAGGPVITIRLPKQFQNSLELLGRSQRGWVVDYHHTATLYHLSRAGQLTKLFHYTNDEGFEGFAAVTMSTNGRLFAIRDTDQTTVATYHIYNLAGKQVDAHLWTSGRLVAFQGRTLYVQPRDYSPRSRLQTWTVGSAPVDTAVRGAALLDLAHHRVLRLRSVRPPERFGLASTSAPGDVRWTLCAGCNGHDLRPVAFSPDGKRLAFLDARKVLQVRAASDGHRVTNLSFDAQAWNARWEDPRHVLIEVLRTFPGQVLDQSRHAMLRCSLGGTCARVTPWQHHWLLGYQPPNP